MNTMKILTAGAAVLLATLVRADTKTTFRDAQGRLQGTRK